MINIRHTLIAIALFTPTLLIADTREEFNELMNGNETKAFQMYLSKAQKGDSEAQHVVSMLYKDGIGVEQDHSKHIKWLRAAADQGFIASSILLGILSIDDQTYISEQEGINYLIYGINNFKDIKEVYGFFPQDNFLEIKHDAAILLADAYQTGNGVEKNIDEMCRYNEIGAEGIKDSRLAIPAISLGTCYYNGTKYTPKNIRKAVKWLKLAASQDHTLALLKLSTIYSTEEYPEYYNIEKSKQLLIKSSTLGNATAQLALGLNYYAGRKGFKKNTDKGLRLINESAENGNTYAQELLRSTNTNENASNGDIFILSCSDGSGETTIDFTVNKTKSTVNDFPATFTNSDIVFSGMNDATVNINRYTGNAHFKTKDKFSFTLTCKKINKQLF